MALKRFYRDKKHRCCRLHPENSKMKDIYVQDCTIQDVAQNVIKALYYSMKNIEGKTSAAVWKQKTISFLINSTYQKERRTYKENLYLFENSGILSQPYLVLYDK